MSLMDTHSLITGAPTLLQRFLVARVEACWDIVNEDTGNENHANRIAWANSILDAYEGHSQSEYLRFLSNPTIRSSGIDSTDNDIQFVVNSMADAWASDYVGA